LCLLDGGMHVLNLHGDDPVQVEHSWLSRPHADHTRLQVPASAHKYACQHLSEHVVNELVHEITQTARSALPEMAPVMIRTCVEQLKRDQDGNTARHAALLHLDQQVRSQSLVGRAPRGTC
jgi:hypothetical protein